MSQGEKVTPLEVEMNFHLSLPGQPQLTDVRCLEGTSSYRAGEPSHLRSNRRVDK